jgi:DNA polymerase I-like protein with 3'-5' exonuclease and polymerase domains
LVGNGLKDAFDEIESPVQSILTSTECNGIGFKVDRLVKIQSGIESRIEELSVEARNIAKDNSFMLSSPQQVSQLLFVKLGIKAPLIQSAKAASSGKQHQSTSEETLKAIQQEAKSKNTGQGLSQ